MIKISTICAMSLALMSISCDKKSENLLTLAENENEHLHGEPDLHNGNVVFNDVTYVPGDTIWGHKNYVYLVVGSEGSPLILGVPHDGVAEGSPVLPEVTTTGRDIYSHPFASLISQYFEADTDKKPWMIVNTIGRKRVDPNTYPSDAITLYNADAYATYQSYHQLLLFARNAVLDDQKCGCGKGALFLDVHGHAHTYTGSLTQNYISVVNGTTASSNFIHQTEVGYGISNWALEQNNTYLNTVADSSSIYNLSVRHPLVNFSDLIRGDSSFGSLLHVEGVASVPSNAIPVLDRNHTLFGGTATNPTRRPYFNGGYCTRAYGTIQSGSTIGFNDNIIAIQIETPGINVRNNANTRERSSHQFKRAIIRYLNIWMGYSFGNSAYPYTKYW